MSELKAINAHGVRKDDGAYYDRSQVDKYIDELDERHTAEITALEVSYRLQLDGLRYDKDAEIRRLKRALWLERANKAESEARGWYHSNDYIIKYNGLHNIKGVLYGKGFKRYPEEWMKLWIKIERLCLAKVEEYK